MTDSNAGAPRNGPLRGESRAVESWHTYGWVMSHLEIVHVTHYTIAISGAERKGRRESMRDSRLPL